MRPTIPLLLAAALVAGSAVSLGGHLTGWAQTVPSNAESFPPPGPPTPGATAPWLATWDPVGHAGGTAADGKAAALAEKSDAVLAANAAAFVTASAVESHGDAAHDDARAALLLLLEGDAGATGASDLLMQHTGLGLPSGALLQTSFPMVPAFLLPDPSLVRPTAALAVLMPPDPALGETLPGPSDLAASRDAVATWGMGIGAYAAERHGEATEDLTTFATNAGSYAGATVDGATSAANGIATLLTSGPSMPTLPGLSPPDAPSVPTVEPPTAPEPTLPELTPPEAPSVPTVEPPAAPSLPEASVPEAPSVPTVEPPAVPSLPEATLPEASVPDVEVPAAPAVPEPSVPETPELPALPVS